MNKQELKHFLTATKKGITKQSLLQFLSLAYQSWTLGMITNDQYLDQLQSCKDLWRETFDTEILVDQLITNISKEVRS